MFRVIIINLVIFLGLSESLFAQEAKNKGVGDTTVLVTDNFSNSKSNTPYLKSYTITVDTNHRPINLTYDQTAGLASDFFVNGNYLKAAQLFEKAIEQNKGLGKIKDRYKLACCYAKLGNSDSAFVHLFRIVKSTKYYDLRGLENEVLLKSLNADERWKQVLKIVEENIQKLNEETNKRIKESNF